MTALRNAGSHLAFIWDRNLMRLLILLGVLTVLIAANGTLGVIDSVIGLLASLPAFALQLSFAAAYIIFQFGILFWFLSRPRKYTVTPDDPQIGLSFDDYRGQPDLLAHARTTVGILRGVKEFPRACSSPARPAPARRSWPRASPGKPTCPSSTSMPVRSRACSSAPPS
jgi:hypothetical protein